MSDNIDPSWEDVQGRRYPGYGECIYCGSNGGNDGLRDEHIIPLSINGDTIIEKASCTTCEKSINRADIHLAKSVYWHYRLHTGSKTRNPKDRPDTLTASIEIGGEQTKREFSTKEFPFSTALPIWGEAGFFRGAPIDAPFPETLFHIYHWMPRDIRDKLGLSDDEQFKIWSSGRVSAELFARAIAKIAYCHMIVRHGLYGFRRLALPSVILGQSGATPYFVGTPLRLPPPPLGGKALHMVQHVDLASKAGPLKLHLINVRLFASSAHEQHGMPIYHVIAGAPNRSRD
jgi:HNH endonuclease